MEKLVFRFDGGKLRVGKPTLVGVLASGNLEVLVESAALSGSCEIEITTAASGFGETWKAVLADFFERHRAGNVRISVNDAGATPAIVSLRLDQAMQSFLASHERDA